MGVKRALLIGINYTGTANKLDGCINDAKNVGKLLESRGWVCVYLLDEAGFTYPTRANILSEIHTLVLATKPKDSLFFHYSGHGTSTIDREGDEEDGRDEAICPLFGNVITDDELRVALVDRLPLGSFLFMLLDSCHSGTGSDLRYNYDDVSKCKTPKIPDEYDAQQWARRIAKRETGRCPETKAAVMCLSGCRDSQTSADTVFDNKACGAMTASFLRALDANPDGNLCSIYQHMACLLRCYRYSQSPQLSLGNRTLDSAFMQNTAKIIL